VAGRQTPSQQVAVALDIGGTNIKAGVITLEGELIHQLTSPTPAFASPETVSQKILSIIQTLCAQTSLSPESLSGIGISIAAFITADGIVTATAHLSKEWVGFNLLERLSHDFPADYYFSLDTPAPTLGEAYYGAGRNIPDLAYITVSTGIGAGIMVNGQYFTGGMGWAGGIGHIIIDEASPRQCEGCGNYGCLETFAAKRGIILTAQSLLKNHPESLLHTLIDADSDRITPQLIYEAAKAGDPIAIKVFQRAGHALGIGLVSMADIVSPTRIVVGGGIACAGDFLLQPARDVVRARAFPPQIRQVEIVQAALGDLSGIFGAAAMVFHRLRINV